MIPRARHARAAWPALALGAVLAGCTDEKIVYVDRELFEPVQEAALSFLGYSKPEEKLTVCGNCHVDAQLAWEQTGHAFAWEGLQSSGHAQAFCEGCHTVNSLGTPTVEGLAGGWLAVKDERYHDVQCENCHGPGLAHVQNPTDATIPLAPVAARVDQSGEGGPAALGCAECHSGEHHPFVEEWALSAHARIPHAASPAGREACAGCHVGEAALQMFGVKADYLEKDEALGSATANLGITCAVCHDPHEKVNEAQLRYPVSTASIEEHLCAQCHDRRTSPAGGSSHGLHPHSPESALLVGEAGFFFPGTSIAAGDIYGTHGPGGNPKLCATCHVSTFDVTDGSGVLIQGVTGHLFNAIPCVNEQGVPRAGDCAVNPSARSFNGCTGSGCHANAQAASSALSTAALRLQTLADELHHLLEQVDPNLDGAGGAIHPSDQVITTAEGAFFNMELAVFGGDITGTGTGPHTYGSAAHNPFLMEALLIQSIKEVKRVYGATGHDRVALEPQLTDPGTH